MPVATEITRLINAKAAIRAAIIAKGVSVPLGDTLDDYAAHIAAISTGPATAPGAFTAPMWSLTGGNAQATIGVGSLPPNGGSPLTALEYRIAAGSAVGMSGTGTGDRIVSSLTNGTPYDFQIRAVNAIGAGPWSDTKTVTPAAPGITYVRFAGLTSMTETGNATDGWIYTGTATDGRADNADWSLALGTAGGIAADVSGGVSPIVGLYTAATGAWDSNFLLIAYPSSGQWNLNGPGFSNLVTSAQSYTAGDTVRVGFGDTGNTYICQIARAAAPTTWLTLGTGTQARSGALFPRLTSFDGAGGVFNDPRVF